MKYLKAIVYFLQEVNLKFVELSNETSIKQIFLQLDVLEKDNQLVNDLLQSLKLFLKAKNDQNKHMIEVSLP